MAYLEELLPEFRKGAKIRNKYWEKNEYICIKNDKVVDEKGNYLNDFYNRYLLYDEWELYQEPIDWDYIIKNKCMCLFWNSLGKAKYLNYLQAKEEHTFRDELGSCWDKCRPVRRDEVTFYEDKKDLLLNNAQA